MATTMQSASPDSFESRPSTQPFSRRSLALAEAATRWPSSSDLFTDDFLADVPEEDNRELANLLTRLEDFSETSLSRTDDLFKFRDLLLEASQSLFLRWKLLNHLRTMALTDELTGLYNRRGFLLLATHNLCLSQRSGNPLFLFFADVDGLKRINDRCGHLDGDALLVCCGEVLKMTFREADLIARIGGDEFAILAQCESFEACETITRRLHASIDLMNRDVLAPYRLSLSVGAAKFDPTSPVSLAELLAVADREMMKRKQAA